MGWLIALGVIAGIAVIPVGIQCMYRNSNPLVRLIAGPIRITLYPTKKKTASKAPAPKKFEEHQKQTGRSDDKLSDFLPLLRTLLDFLGDLRRKLRVNRLELKLILSGGDPCDLGMNYGRAWAVVGNLLPLLESVIVIKKRNVEVECDFNTDETQINIRIDLTLTTGRLLLLAGRYGVKVFREYFKIINKRKGGAVV